MPLATSEGGLSTANKDLKSSDKNELQVWFSNVIPHNPWFMSPNELTHPQEALAKVAFLEEQRQEGANITRVSKQYLTCHWSFSAADVLWKIAFWLQKSSIICFQGGCFPQRKSSHCVRATARRCYSPPTPFPTHQLLSMPSEKEQGFEKSYWTSLLWSREGAHGFSSHFTGNTEFPLPVIELLRRSN